MMTPQQPAHGWSAEDTTPPPWKTEGKREADDGCAARHKPDGAPDHTPQIPAVSSTLPGGGDYSPGGTAGHRAR
jgi:hypothetical protein